MILGQPIEFARTPYQRVVPREKKILDLNEQHAIDTEIDKLLAKGAITPSSHEGGEYLSPIFTRAKKYGSFRLILNLKCLTTHVQYHHFKMDSLNTVLEMVKSSCFMASIDLKDAYYSVPNATVDQKYLKVLWRGKLYTVLFGGLISSKVFGSIPLAISAASTRNLTSSLSQSLKAVTDFSLARSFNQRL